MASTAHLNFKGHHPKVRPYNSHNNCGGSIKAVKRLLLQALRSCKSDEELFETMVVEMGSSDSGMWYVDTSGCGMLQANDAEPPPKQGWLHKAVQCAAVFLLGLMLLTGPSCKKDPQPSPTPNTPTDTITPVNPGDTITPVNPGDTITPVIPGDTIPDVPGSDTIVPGPGSDTIVPPTPGGDTLQPGTYDTIPGRKVILRVDYPSNYGIRFPTIDTVRYYANHPGCDTIYIKWYVPPDVTVQWTPGVFHVAFDSLEQRFDLTDKCRGARDIVVSKNYGGASIPDEELLTHSKYGMTVSDSIRCTNWGYHPRRDQNCKSYTPYNGNRVLKAGRSR